MGIWALLGPTNTGKTHRAIEQLLSHETGMIGLPLRLLAREVYDRVTQQVGERHVALVTGEEKRIGGRPRYWICTVEAMPVEREVDFVCVDEIQLATHRQRGHTFTDRLLNLRGRRETWFLGSDSMRPVLETLVPTARVRRHPRFSKLSYGGVQSVGSLPPRSAIVAFSVAEVYELAERVRQRHGGTAVVLGALSPRARNAQVAMYEAGEVEYMVATDAVGMGLNLDLDRVVFASTRKFDGHHGRPLEPAELAQIAGRAGRYTRDGTFSVLRPEASLDPKIVHAIENHAFEPARAVVWRNSDLDFSTLEALEASLRARPQGGSLQMLERADDFDALTQLSRLGSVRKRARGERAIRLLWDVCRIPDFRKLMLESHVQLLARIYDQLSGADGRLDESWMRRRIERLDDVGGDIDALMTKMAFIRTWTYVANHEQWVPHASHWQQLTREIEDRQSDALHARLTERFVGSTAGRPARPAGRRRAAPRPQAAVGPSDPDPSHPFAALAGLAVVGPPAVDDPVRAIVDADHSAFGVDAFGTIACDGIEVGAWRPGRDLARPEVRVSLGGLAAGSQARVRRRLQAWTVDVLDELLEPLAGPWTALLTAPARGLLYLLQQGLGTVRLEAARDQVHGLQAADRVTLRAHGVCVGKVAASAVHAMEPALLLVRHALCWTFAPWEGGEAGWDPGERSRARSRSLADEQLARLGWVGLGERAVRVDLAERVATLLDEESALSDPFVVPEVLTHWLSCRPRQLSGVLRSLGYWRVRGGEYSRTRPRPRPRLR